MGGMPLLEHVLCGVGDRVLRTHRGPSARASGKTSTGECAESPEPPSFRGRGQEGGGREPRAPKLGSVGGRGGASLGRAKTDLSLNLKNSHQPRVKKKNL